MNNTKYEIKQDGTKATWGNGAIRYNKDKGRHDLIPWDVIMRLVDYVSTNYGKNGVPATEFSHRGLVTAIHTGMKTGYFYKAIMIISVATEMGPELKEIDSTELINANTVLKCLYSMVNKLAIHFQKGAEKYGERNCEKGIPLWSFIDSGLRHTVEYLREKNDEPHSTAAVWNFVMADWTRHNHPEWCDERPNNNPNETSDLENKTNVGEVDESGVHINRDVINDLISVIVPTNLDLSSYQIMLKEIKYAAEQMGQPFILSSQNRQTDGDYQPSVKIPTETGMPSVCDMTDVEMPPEDSRLYRYLKKYLYNTKGASAADEQSLIRESVCTLINIIEDFYC